MATISLEKNGFAGAWRIIDVSDDGPNTRFESVEVGRDTAVAKGITINGLVIEQPAMPDLLDYYRNGIVGGPPAFVIRAESRKTFAKAILKKLTLDIAIARFNLIVPKRHDTPVVATR